MKLSIVTTLYCSAPYIEEFCSRVSKCAQQIAGEDYEIILVNDGSPDRSLDIAVELTRKDHHFAVVDLTRNFGHHKAVMAGLEAALGEYIYLIDIDLEEDPEWLLDFWEQMKKTEVDLINGQQVFRKGNLFEKFSGNLYYLVYNFFSKTKIQPNLTMAKLMTKRFKDAMIRYQERSLFLGGVIHSVGFDIGYYPCTKKHKGTTTYNFSRKLAQALDSIVSFSARPLYYLLALGTFIFILSILAIGYLIKERLVHHAVPTGWTSLVVVTLGMSGLVIISIGIVGVYIAKLFEEVKARPNYIVRKIYRNSEDL